MSPDATNESPGRKGVINTVWITSKVNIPDPVLRASEEGRLAVFAGAGVSMGPPSNLPDFKGLAKRVGSGTGIELMEGERIEDYLGKLQTNGTSVHTLVRERLTDPTSLPKQVHLDILRIFRDSANVRIITTNFDNHFTTAADQVFGGGSVHCHYAPGLPLGGDFSGIVYLHGSVSRREKDMLLTDKDFGRAYLLDGWASRFLHQLFSSYTVVFMGYSHDDTVMHYVSRGLGPSFERYAFAQATDALHWTHHGISPIVYPLEATGNRYCHFDQCISSWASRSRQRLTDHVSRMISIADGLPPLDPEGRDYLLWMVSKESTLAIFTAHARGLDWLEWADREGLLNILFTPALPLKPTDRLWIEWIIQGYFVEHSYDIITLLSKRQGAMHPELWNACTRGLASSLGDMRERYGSGIVSLWSSILVGSGISTCNREYAEMLLEQCQLPADLDAAMILLEFITEPSLSLLASFGYPDFASLPTEGDAYFSCQNFYAAWETVFKDHLDCCAGKLLDLITHKLQKANLLTTSSGGSEFGWRRAAIDENQDNVRVLPLDSLIDAARECIEWEVANNRYGAEERINRLIRSDAPLIRRLGVHGISQARYLGADRQLTMVLDAEVLCQRELRHEVLRLLIGAYGDASNMVRERIINASPVDETDPVAFDHQKLDLLSLLAQTHGDCSLLTRAIEELEEEYPLYYPETNPDLYRAGYNHQTIEPLSPITATELLRQEPRLAAMNISALVKDGPAFYFSMEMVLGSVADAIMSSFEWGLQFAAELVDDERSLLWSAIFRAWEGAGLDTTQLSKVLDLIESAERLHTGKALASFLYDISSKLDSNQNWDRCFNRLETVIHVVARAVLSHDVTLPVDLDNEIGGWAEKALNHQVGLLAISLIHCLSLRKSLSGDSWRGMPDRYRVTLRDGLARGTSLSGMVRCVVAGQYHYLDSVDPEWTAAEVFPFFSWSYDHIAARQAWDGFLIWGSLTEPIIERLRPFYIEASTGLGSVSKRTDRFWNSVVRISIRSTTQPLAQDWLPRIVSNTTEDGRLSFVKAMERALRGMDETEIRAIWDSWLCDYWANRVSGRPRPLSAAEAGAMVSWALASGSLFPEVVAKVEEGTVPDLTSSRGILIRLSRSELVTRFPRDVARLLIVAMRGMSPGQTVDIHSAFEIANALREGGVENDLFERLREGLLGLACVAAASLGT